MVHPSAVSADVVSNILIIERVNSSISIVGCLFILLTFLFLETFDRPINRLIAFASAGNLMTNIATLIGNAQRSDESGFICQAQGFLIQMFMGADILWTLAMAINVYLTFYHKFDALRLRQMEKWYFLLCYGIPFLPAISYIFAESPEKGRIYGDSLLWCWIKPEYDYLRIGTFYAPIWVIVLATFGIYLRAGREIWRKRSELQKMIKAGVKNYGDNMLNPYDLDGGMIYEIQETADEYGRSRAHPVVNVNVLGRTLSAADKHSRAVSSPYGYREDVVTSVTVTSEVTTTIEEPMPEKPKPTYEYHIGTMPMFPSRPKKPKKDKRKPAGGKVSKVDEITRNTTNEETEQERLKQQLSNDPQTTLVAYQANRAAWGYTKVSAMFFAAMLITWVPSSANRLWSMLNERDVSISLLYASAFVLPLQGMWNCIIYCITSSEALKNMVKGGKGPKPIDAREKEEDEMEMMERRKSGALGDVESNTGRMSPETTRSMRQSKYSQSTVGSTDGGRYVPKGEDDSDGFDFGDMDARNSRPRTTEDSKARGAHGGHSIGSILKHEREGRRPSVDSIEEMERAERRLGGSRYQI